MDQNMLGCVTSGSVIPAVLKYFLLAWQQLFLSGFSLKNLAYLFLTYIAGEIYWKSFEARCDVVLYFFLKREQSVELFWSTILSGCYILINMSQLQILFYETKTWHRIVWWFSWISLFLPVLAWSDHTSVLQIKTKHFYDQIMQKLVKIGKFS